MLVRSIGVLYAVGLAFSGCDSSGTPQKTSATSEARQREIERRIKDSLPKTEEIALAQTVDAETVRTVQGELRTLHEYMDEPSGKLDAVTVNAVEAFQRRAGLRDDGLLDPRTRDALTRAAATASR